MTTINSIANMLVTSCGLSEAEAFEAVANYTEADYLAEVEAERIAAERQAEWEAELAEERFFEEQLSDFFHKYIEGKSYDELDPEAWGTYSDLYKDLHGIRPRWYIQSLYEAKQRAEAQAEREELENDGWIFLDTPYRTYKRQLEGFEMTVWVWDNHGMTYEALCGDYDDFYDEY